MDQELIDDALRFVEVASVTVKRAMDDRDVLMTAQKKAAALRPGILAHLLKTNTVAAHQKEAAEAMLASHAETLGLLQTAVTKLAEERQKHAAKTAGDLGQGKDSNGAVPAYDSLNDPFVGRRTSQKKASDLAILAVLDAAPPH